MFHRRLDSGFTEVIRVYVSKQQLLLDDILPPKGSSVNGHEFCFFYPETGVVGEVQVVADHPTTSC